MENKEVEVVEVTKCYRARSEQFGASVDMADGSVHLYPVEHSQYTLPSSYAAKDLLELRTVIDKALELLQEGGWTVGNDV